MPPILSMQQLGTHYLVSTSQCRPYDQYQVNGNYMYWHDYAVIKLNHSFESLNKTGLVKRFDAQSRLLLLRHYRLSMQQLGTH